MGIKKSVNLSDTSRRFIDNRNRGEPAWSSTINGYIEAVSWVIRDSIPKLSQHELEMLFNVYGGPVYLETPYRIASDIMDHFDVITFEDLNAEYVALVEKVYDFNQAQQLAILDVNNRYWVNKQGDLSTDQILEIVLNQEDY